MSSRRTARVRDFARRSGFTYQQAHAYLAYFQQFNSGKTDDAVLVILCSEIRVGDRILTKGPAPTQPATTAWSCQWASPPICSANILMLRRRAATNR